MNFEKKQVITLFELSRDENDSCDSRLAGEHNKTERFD